MAVKVKAAPKVSIKLMTDEDIDGVLAIDRKLRGAKRAISFADPIDDYVGGEVGVSCVARAESRVVGVILGRLVTMPNEGIKVAWIQILGIDPDLQGQGIGTKLVKAFETQASKKGAERIHLLTMPSDKTLKPFFESVGYSAGKFIQLQKKLAA